MSKKLSIALAASAGLFATITVFVGLPSIIYAANPGEFSFPFLNIIFSYWIWGVAFLALAVVPALVLPPKPAQIWAAGIAVVAIYVWGHGIFQTHSFGAIDGQSWSVNVPKWQIGVEAIVILAGAVLVFVAALRLQKMVAIFSLVLAAGLLFQSWPTLKASTWLPVSDENQFSKVSNFSTKGNALVVLMDTMASDVFQEVVTQDPVLARALDGFTLFPDTVGASPTTFLALPTIHSGKVYRSGIPTAQFFAEAVRDHSVLTKIANAGYHSTLVNPIQNICPANVECLTADAAMRSTKSVVRSEGINILDAVLFRLAPLGLKNAAYNEGEWIIQNLVEDERFIQRAVQHNYFLQDLAAKMTVTSDVPTLKFLHLMNTHPPYVFNRDCGYAGGQLDRSRENFSIQVRCSVERFAELLNAMKAHGIYDQTTIILLADHGNYGIESTRTEIKGSRAKIVGAANPTFAIKPVGAKGPIRTAGGEIYIGDFGATLCDLLKACTVENGVSALQEPYGRTRLFNYYRWKNEFWKTSSISGLTPYEIRGPLGRKENWVKDAPIRVGQTIDFGGSGAGLPYLWNGFSQPEDLGTWTDGAVATLVMNPDQRVPSSITLHVVGFVNAGAVRATVAVDEKSVGEIVLDKAKPEGNFTFRIPDEALEDGAIKVDFAIAEPRSPKEIGLSSDDRKLGLQLRSLKISPHES